MKAKNQNQISGIATAILLVASSGRADICNPQVSPRQDMGVVSYASITEASGLAASRRNAGVYYTHNDSGHSAKVYAINEQGQHLCTYTIGTWGARDWEDIACGPGPVDGEKYLYVSETGDNSAQWPSVYILRMIEPSVSATQASTYATISNYDVIQFQYPDGPRDCETLMVDPLTKDIYVVSKRETQVKVYRLPYPQSTTSMNTAQEVAAPAVWNWIVAGDISPSGYEILIKNGSIVYHWCRQAGQTIGQAMSATPVQLPYTQEPQGEAICWRADGGGYFTLSEGASQHLYFYPIAQPTNTPPVDPTNEPPPAADGSYVEHDFNGDGAADLAVFWGTGDKWYLQQSGSNVFAVNTWGDVNATPIPGDYNGDGAAELATYNPANGVWNMRLASNDIVSLQYGWSSTKPVPADYDGDGVTDIAVFHPDSGTWYLMMSTAGFQTRQFGWSAVRPVPADYDGDGKDDLAVYHPQTGNWYLLQSRDGLSTVQFGWSAAVPVPADYDGDGKADIAVYHAQTGTWYIRQSTGGVVTKQFGWTAASPVPADYDGDGKADIAVYHQALGNWYVQQTGGGFFNKNFGWSAAEPVTSATTILLNH